MKLIKPALGLAVAALVAGALALALGTATPASAARICKSPVTGSGTAKNNEPLAKSRAKDNWRTNALAAYGNGYGLWLNASGVSLTCNASGKFGNKTWNCAATATPCKGV